MTSNKPYLLRAIYEWIVDNNTTPHVVIFADNPQVIVPQQFVEEGRIILNISPTAAKDLLIDNEGMSFSARFGGKPYNVYSPMEAVLALYASENSQGMSFELDDSDLPPDDNPPDPPKPQSNQSKSSKLASRPTLKVVK